MKDSKFIKDCKMENIEMSEILSTIAMISSIIIGVIILFIAIYVVYNIVKERKDIKLFYSEEREN